MQKDSSYLCSDLITLTVGRTVVVGNLEQICEGSCSVTIEEPQDIGTPVRMHCVSCPQGKAKCTECQFKGKVLCYENDPTLGCALEIEFEGRKWSAREWHPRHLTNIDAVTPEPKPRKQRKRAATLELAQSHK